MSLIKNKVKGKAKGNSFERFISKTLSLYITNNKNPNVLWRSQNSGGRATILNKKGVSLQNQEGDISSIHPDSKDFCDVFYLELKNYKRIDLWGLITDSNNLIGQWWKTSAQNSKEIGKTPVLIIKSSHKPILWITNKTFHKFMKTHSGPKEVLIYTNLEEKIYVYKLDDILNMDLDILNKIIYNLKNIKEEIDNEEEQ